MSHFEVAHFYKEKARKKAVLEWQNIVEMFALNFGSNKILFKTCCDKGSFLTRGGGNLVLFMARGRAIFRGTFLKPLRNCGLHFHNFWTFNGIMGVLFRRFFVISGIMAQIFIRFTACVKCRSNFCRSPRGPKAHRLHKGILLCMRH